VDDCIAAAGIYKRVLERETLLLQFEQSLLQRPDVRSSFDGIDDAANAEFDGLKVACHGTSVSQGIPLASVELSLVFARELCDKLRLEEPFLEST
jgi:hypothetical protein